jgi:CRISPR-associated protein Cas1
MLNYSYGVLYSLVEKACILAGLDPFVGFLHTDNYNKKSLVFDLRGSLQIDFRRIIRA